MITPISSLLTVTAPLGGGTQSDFVYVVLPALALTLGLISIGSHVTTRVIKKLL